LPSLTPKDLACIHRSHEENEFCRRGQMRQKNGDACAGMPDTAYGAKQSPAPSDLGYRLPPFIWKCEFTCAEPLWASLAAYAADRLNVVVDLGVGPWDPRLVYDG
jgi:hypothetical protein